MKTITFNDQEFAQICRVAKKRNRSAKSMIMKMIRDIDHQDEEKDDDSRCKFRKTAHIR